VQLRDAGGRIVAETTLRLPMAPSKRPLFLEAPSLDPGRHVFSLEVEPVEGESVREDNSSEIVVHVLEEAVRVLVVEGAPYWDTKFIAQLLQREAGFEFELIYRLSEERFFRLDGLHETEATGAARPVFPSTQEELATYDVVVFGKNVETFLDASQARLLRDWVTERGGALLLARGRPFSSPVDALEPLFPMQWEKPWRQPYRWRPTMAAEDTGLFGSVLPGRASDIWKRLPELGEAVYGAELAPFTRVLVEGVGVSSDAGGRTFPAVVSRRVGDGTIVSIQSGDLWRWDFIPQVEEARSIYRDFWLQLFHWIVAYSEFLPGKEIALHLSEATIAPGESVRVRVLQRGADAPAGEPPVLMMLASEEDAGQPMALVPMPDREQAWETVFTLDEPGDYTFQLSPSRLAEANKRVFAQLHVKAAPGEQDQLDPDPAALERLTVATGGQLVDSIQALRPFLTNETQNPDAATGNAEWQSRWDQPWVLVLMLSFFVGEWMIRRREGFI